ncbi:hypothetical protein BASA81_008316 [Batrachochytrium salamandrivorans]|nr:hypothetical protein BASA81_008316 [Batrachochytrium salamandrivorans]
MDQTQIFRSLCRVDGNGQPPVRAKRAQFHLVTTCLSNDLVSLEKEIKLFHRDQARGTMTGTSLSKSGAAISTGAERVQKKLADIERTLSQVKATRAQDRSQSRQAIQHLDKVVAILESQLSALAKAFQLDLQQSAKKLAGRQERQNNVFGKSVNYAPKTDSIRFRGAAASAPAAVVAPLFGDDAPPMMMQQQQVKKNAYETSRTLGRTQEVERVESMIGEVSQMFMRVAGMVQEQGELVQDIESLVDDSAANTSQAQTELLKLFRFVSSDRALIIKLLLTVLLVGMVMIYFWT